MLHTRLVRLTLIILTTALIVGGFSLVKSAQAATSTVMGKAWWGGAEPSYLYMDCSESETGDHLDSPGNFNGNADPPGFKFFSSPCSTINYHTYINDLGNFSGSAWNDTRGLVTFDATTPPPFGYAAFNTNCPNLCDGTNNCWACYNENDQKVYGWARVVNDGTWIKFDTATSSNYVQIKSWDMASDTAPFYNSPTSLAPGDFVGNATTSVDTISFNCKSEYGLNNGGSCGSRDYKVYIGNLQIAHLSAPNWSYSDACDNRDARKAVLKWWVKSGQQAGYEIVVNTANPFVSTSTATCWSGIQTNAVARQYTVDSSNCPAFSYNTNYYWWVRLYDANGQATQWYQFGAVDGHNGALDEQTDGDPDSESRTFTTYKHEFPSPFFSWTPFDILVGTSTDFTAIGTTSSQYYTTAAPLTPVNCSGPNCFYVWSTSDDHAIISATTSATTSITFQDATGTTASLLVTDIDSYVCSTSTALNINYGLPIWREVKAE